MEKIFIWGTGSIADDVVLYCDIFRKYNVLGFIDNDIKKQGTLYNGRPVFAPDILKEQEVDKIVILTNCYKEIVEQIQEYYPEKMNCIENRCYFDKEDLFNRYANSQDPEILNILEYIQNHELTNFNYEFVDKYKNMEMEICFDDKCGMYYAIYNNKRMYFSREINTYQKAEDYYKQILLEQDIESPHRYLTADFNVQEGDIVVDVGVAEGNFALDVIDKVKKIYLIEVDEGWIQALKETFKENLDRVVIIDKYVTSLTKGKYVTLDSIINENVDFIKMDIEGNEWDALLGAENLIRRSPGIRCAVCSYHRPFDEVLIKDVLERYGLECSTSPGYMWFHENTYNTMVRSWFLRGIVRGINI